MSSPALTFTLRTKPDCWEDDKRMTVLFSPFRPKEVNPIDYEAKLTFWKELLNSWCAECRRSTFSIRFLQGAFKRKNLTPVCLQTVVDELLKSGDVMTKDDFMRRDPHQSWTKWAVKCMITTPAVWSFNKMKEALAETDPGSIEYISIKYLRAASKEVTTKCERDGCSLINLEDLKNFLVTDEDQASLVLRWMINDSKATSVVHENETLIKIGKDPITEGDIAVVRLNKTISSLNDRIDLLEKSKTEAFDEAKSNLSSGRREKAKQCLRRKKELEMQITRRLNAVLNLETLLNNLKDAKTDAEILETYKLGIKTLKNTYSEKNLNDDSVADVMSMLQEINEISNDISNGLSQPLDPIEEDELQAELSSILDEDLLKPTTEVPNLPDVPSARISPHKERPSMENALSA